ncbi:MAG: 2OG-Fe(II) oxygenase [Pseudomonadota bacterium]|nr:2OG-Fe(II) oxygenase [Pseudomonadota bacterium]
MYSPPQPELDQNPALCEQIADALVAQGYLILPSALPEALGYRLYHHLQTLDGAQFRRAGIGREQDHQLHADIRRDQIRWLSHHCPVEAEYLRWMDQLRQGLNRRLFMGLFDYEAHFAHYPQGAFYKRHLDAFRGQTNRVLTTVCYLNPHWQPRLGGELLIWPTQESTLALARVVPQMGTLVVFLSERFPHEVRPARADRYSIAGWFRVNASINNQIDPPR